MNMKLLSIYGIVIFLALGILSCTNKQSNNDSSSSAQQMPEANASLGENYVLQLYANYVQEPKLQAHKDENIIIDYILGQDIAYQRSNSGLYYAILEIGEGNTYNHGEPCSAHYQGYFLDGRVFDSSIEKGKPLNFRVGQMVAGWNEALKLLTPGSQAKLILPSALAYGDRGFPGYVPPNSVIAFDLQTLELTTAAQ